MMLGIPPPKDFPEFMSGALAVVVIGTALGVGGYEILTQGSGAADWRGAFLVAFTAVLTYWVGSSSGSRRKTDDATAIAKTQVVAAEVAKVVLSPETAAVPPAVASKIEAAVTAAVSPQLKE